MIFEVNIYTFNLLTTEHIHLDLYLNVYIATCNNILTCILISQYRHLSLSAVNWFQKKNRALSETSPTELRRKVSVQKLR
jgi:hypothetical protein